MKNNFSFLRKFWLGRFFFIYHVRFYKSIYHLPFVILDFPILIYDQDTSVYIILIKTHSYLLKNDPQYALIENNDGVYSSDLPRDVIEWRSGFTSNYV